MKIRLETKQIIEIDEVEWRALWLGNFSVPVGESCDMWTAGMLRDRPGRSLLYVKRDGAAADEVAVGELGRPRPEDIAPILRRLCERAGLAGFPETWEKPAVEASSRGA